MNENYNIIKQKKEPRSMVLKTSDNQWLRKAEKLVEQMTLEEKISLLSGADTWHTKAIPRLGLESIMLSDGPHGLRKQVDAGDNLGIGESVPATCFPAAVTMACSFDPELIERMGRAMGEECLQEQVSVILGPGINHKRDPRCGRNFEYYSEDPLVSGTLGSALVKGVQSTGVGTSLKHFAANNQEKRRMTIDARVDERTLHEIYLKAFRQVIEEADPMTVMCSYNRLNGEYNSENKFLLTEILRKQWGYGGIVVSDWGAVHDRALGVQTGLDLEMPGNQGYNDKKVAVAVKAGKVSEKELDTVATRITALILQCMDTRKETFRYDASKHHSLAIECACKGAVLLKNEGLLPGNRKQDIAIIGALAEKPRYQGAGSSKIHPKKLDTPLAMFRQEWGNVDYAPGYTLMSLDKTDPDDLIKDAVTMAKGKDIVYLFAGLPESYESEGFDREDLSMPEPQNRLIREVSSANPNTVVILMGGAPIELPWIDQVPSVLLMYLGGEGCGQAALDLLLGRINPSGKLAETWPIELEDVPSYRYFPGDEKTVEYREGIFTGYRYYDSVDCPVRFPFGYGLSYTTFEYLSMEVHKEGTKGNETITVTVSVKNSGNVEGEETVFLYSSHSSEKVFLPKKELRGFYKMKLAPGETGVATFGLSAKDLGFYNTKIHDWTTEPGAYTFWSGPSGAEVPLKAEINIEGTNCPGPDLRTTAPIYYKMGKGKEVPRDQFEQLIGEKLPEPVARISRPYCAEHTLENARHNLFGKLLLKYVDHLAAKVSQSEEGQEGMMAAAMKEMPLFALVASGEDMFPEYMMNAVLDLLNGNYIRGLNRVIKREK